MKVLYVDSFGGYVADFGTYMEAYSLRGEQEVKDVISYIESTKTALVSFKEPIVLMLGGLDRGHSFDELIPYLKNVKFNNPNCTFSFSSLAIE